MKFIFLFLITSTSLLIIISQIAKINTIAKNDLDKAVINLELIQETDTTFGIVVWDLNTQQKYFLNENEQFEAASLYKLALMYTLFYLESKGKLDTDQPDIKASLNSMITVSSNKAALYLLDSYTSWDEIAKLLTEKGLKQTEFTKDHLLTTPWDEAKLLALINDPYDIGPKSREKMMELLKSQTINDRIPALLPAGVTVFHKTADLDDVSHDVGIVTGPGSTRFILVIMTKNSDEPENIKPVMARISVEIYNLLK